MTPVRAVLFDLDDTLSDADVRADVLRLTCRDIALARPALDQSQLIAANQATVSTYLPDVDDAWTLGTISGRSVTTEIWRRTLERCGCSEPEMASWAQERYWRHRATVSRLFDDVAPALQEIAGRVPLALVTNGAADTQRHLVTSLGIEGLFRFMFISGEHGVAKPSPVVFEHVLGQLGVDPHDAWHVGDNLDTDVAGAKAGGLTAVWLNRRGQLRPGSDPLPDHEIASLTDLLVLLADRI